ncbi:MlaD family protein [Candidatus Babeliales bacterium]|nr:MlaD family protein [Candidatus Babeliales bacterium]
MRTETRVGLFILAAIGIFLYLSINIRAFRFNKDKYNEYKAYFDDAGGVVSKAVVRIAGVEVGWIDQVNLLSGGKAEFVLRIHKKNKLAKNSYAMINQDGLIGTKNVEIDPGDPTTGVLLPGSTLSMPGKTPATVGELLEQFRDIATGIQDITSSFKTVFASRKGEDNLRSTLESVAKASDRMADFSEILQRTMKSNENNLNMIVSDFRETVVHLKTSIPEITKDVHEVAGTFKESGEKAGDAFGKFGDTAEEARGTFRGATEVVDKINTGKGVIGKLINEDETYGDLKKTIRGFKNYVGKTQSLMLNIDMHSETMLRHSTSKGYLELKLRPSSDYFYLIQLVGDERGSVSREVEFITRRDDKGTILRASELPVPTERKIEWADQVERTVQKKDDVLFGLQFGKRFNKLALRVGLFENTFGAGVDFNVPLNTDKFHWITTFEGFDFRGRNRVEAGRPHLKWLNRVFFLNNLYTTFGLDDFISRDNANPFFGGGLRFGDDDLKYFLGSLPIGGFKRGK